MTDLQKPQLQDCLDRLHAGEASALNDLIASAQERLLLRTRKMLRDFPRLLRWIESDDVYQGAMRRLAQAIEEQTPDSLLHFFNLATQQIRRELIDLARHYFGPEGIATHHHSNDPDSESGGSPSGPVQNLDSSDPARLALWTEFHRQAAALPNDEREVFELRWYQGLSSVEAAQLLDASSRTVQRRWVAAWDRLGKILGDSTPRP